MQEFTYAIEVNRLRKQYGDTVAVAGIDLAIPRGEVFGLLGPNGAGKTTTVECLLGLRKPDEGDVRLLGMEHSAQSRQILSQVGAQLQTTGLLSHLTVWEQVQLFSSFFPKALPAVKILALTGMSEKARSITHTLSGGQKQRLAVALALVNDPDLVFLDEPTTGLDPQARRGIWDLVREMKTAGKTVFLTTHYMEEAEQLCDRVAVMDHGKLIEIGSPRELISRHFQETAIEFIRPETIQREEFSGLPAVSQVRSENGHTILFSSDVPRSLAGLFALVDGGTDALKDVTVRQASLEDVFIKLTGRRIRE